MAAAALSSGIERGEMLQGRTARRGGSGPWKPDGEPSNVGQTRGNDSAGKGDVEPHPCLPMPKAQEHSTIN